jgi:hypothetical protein
MSEKRSGLVSLPSHRVTVRVLRGHTVHRNHIEAKAGQMLRVREVEAAAMERRGEVERV